MASSRTDNMPMNDWAGTDGIRRIEMSQNFKLIDRDFADRGINPRWFNASFSSSTTGIKTTAGSRNVTLDDAIDFEDGQYLAVFGAGPVCDIPAPGTPTITIPEGTGGSTTYIYAVAAIDFRGGMSAASTTVSTTQGNGALSNLNYVQLNWPASTNARGYAIYGRQNGSMTLLGVTAYTTWLDTGKSALIDVPFTMSAVPPAVPSRNIQVAKIESGGGSNTLLLETSIGVTLNSSTAYHDDTIPIQQSFDYAATRSRIVVLPAGTARITKPLQQGSIAVYGAGDDTVISTIMPFINLIESKLTVNPKLVEMKIYGSGYGLQPVNSIGNPIADGAGCGIVYAGVNKGLLDGIFVENCGGDGVTSQRNGVAGVWLTFGCRNVKGYNCYAYRCRNGYNEDDFFGQSSYFNTFRDSESLECRFGFVTDCTTGKGFKLTDCRSVRDRYSGVDISRTNGARVHGHYFEECGNTGISGVYSAALAIYGNANDRVTDFVAEGCTFVDCYSYAAQLSQHTYDCKLKDFNIRGCKNDGAILIKSSRYYQLSNIQIADCVGHGIRGYPEVLGTGGAAATIGIDRGSFENITIHSCTKNGIYLDGAENCTFKGIIINGVATENKSSYGGIVFDKASKENIISVNMITDAGKFGIGSLDADTQFNTINGNLSQHNTGPSLGFISTNQFFMPNSNDRAFTDARVLGAVDTRTSHGKIYVDEFFSGAPVGTTAGEVKIHTTNKQWMVNVDGNWYYVQLTAV